MDLLPGYLKTLMSPLVSPAEPKTGGLPPGEKNDLVHQQYRESIVFCIERWTVRHASKVIQIAYQRYGNDSRSPELGFRRPDGFYCLVGDFLISFSSS